MCLMIDYRKYGLPRKRKVTFPIQTLYKYIQNPIEVAPLTRWRREPRNRVLCECPANCNQYRFEYNTKCS